MTAMFLVKRCSNCSRWNPRSANLCQYCGISLGRYRLCSRGHKNRWDAQFCGICGDVFLTPAAPPNTILQIAVEWSFFLVAIVVLAYFVWEQRFAILLSVGLLIALIYLTAWLFRPFARVLHLWMPWIFLFRLIRRR